MCGIAGYIDFLQKEDKGILKKMISTLNHRGPDDMGMNVFQDVETQVGLGHARLSIIDVSPFGHQPMAYKHLSIVFNGEIYNYKELKRELIALNHTFKSHSDTEVILHAFEEWGTDCVHKFIGMFAFVIYNKEEHCIYLFRDRAGVKPLYYYRKNNLFLFASELKAFHEHPEFEKEIDVGALYAYFDYGYIPSPYAIFQNTYKLEPGTFLKLDIIKNELVKNEYWNSTNFYLAPKLTMDYEDAKNELHELLKSAYMYRMVSDVPVGVFLSGGYDSTSVAAIIQANQSQSLKTFTIGFKEGNNEAPYAKDTAKYLRTDHCEYYCSEKEAQKVIPDLPYYYDEPFADSSAIPTTIVSRLAKENVTVALSADGGDETFAGYNSYPSIVKRVSQVNRIPNSLKPISKRTLRLLYPFIPSNRPDWKHKIDGLGKAMNRDDFELARGIFQESRKLPRQYKSNFINQKIEDIKTKFDVDSSDFKHFVEMLLSIDYQTYLENDILTKVDRATMSTSLEGRDPMLDHRILEFAARLPLSYKYDGNTTKRILKDIVHEYIPKKMMDRPKTGFSLPIYSWLRGDLSYLIKEFLNAEKLKSSGLFDVDFVSKQVSLFEKDQFHYKPFIWKLLMFQMWYERWMN